MQFESACYNVTWTWSLCIIWSVKNKKKWFLRSIVSQCYEESVESICSCVYKLLAVACEELTTVCRVTSWLIQCDELTVWRAGRVTSWLWRVDFLTSWPCDELVMWRVDWQPMVLCARSGANRATCKLTLIAVFKPMLENVSSVWLSDSRNAIFKVASHNRVGVICWHGICAQLTFR